MAAVFIYLLLHTFNGLIRNIDKLFIPVSVSQIFEIGQNIQFSLESLM